MATLTLTPFENFIFTFSKNASVRVLYRDLTMGGVEQLATYRAQLDFSF